MKSAVVPRQVPRLILQEERFKEVSIQLLYGSISLSLSSHFSISATVASSSCAIDSTSDAKCAFPSVKALISVIYLSISAFLS